MIGDLKEVDFHQYCKKCEHKTKSEFNPESPCYDCMDQPFNQDSHKPINFKEHKK